MHYTRFTVYLRRSMGGSSFVGFGSSMVFGTFIGSLADQTGRKKAALWYCGFYIIHNITKHVNCLPVLMVGRMVGGIATSLLFSVFDSWLVSEHHSRGFDPDLLSETFSLAVFGNSVAAVLAGVLSEVAADLVIMSPPAGSSAIFYYGGYCGPFDVSIVVLLLCALMIRHLWSENYGQQTSKEPQLKGRSFVSSQVDVIRDAVRVIWKSADILCCGIVCSLFEASMFIFIFQWTPAVTEPGSPKPPYGLVFATFMVPCMLGSRIFSVASKWFSVERIGQGLLVLALGTHLVTAVSGDPTVAFCAFLFFELSVGIYFPMMGTLKGQIVPESQRATIYNIYRVPLNLIVVLTLFSKIGIQTSFLLTSLLLACALFAQTRLHRMSLSRCSYLSISRSNSPNNSPTNGRELHLEEEMELEIHVEQADQDSKSPTTQSPTKIGRATSEDEVF